MAAMEAEPDDEAADALAAAIALSMEAVEVSGGSMPTSAESLETQFVSHQYHGFAHH